jgi:hypothetical protein
MPVKTAVKGTVAHIACMEHGVTYFNSVKFKHWWIRQDNILDMACGTHGRGEKSVQGFGGKARRKETTWKTKA